MGEVPDPAGSSPISPLQEKLIRLIQETGPLTVENYMSACLYDETYGYYKVRSPLGRSGDFITSPEISQIFGELIGIWVAHTWQTFGQTFGQTLGRPENINIVELGPGRGTLMKDALRALKLVPDLLANAKIHLVETSPYLRECQRLTLQDFDGKIFWHETVHTLPSAPSLLIANEFFDALPVRQLIQHHDNWFERMVSVVEGETKSSPCSLAFTRSPDPLENSEELLDGFDQSLAPNHDQDQAIAEISPSSEIILKKLAEKYAAHPFALLAVDYGHGESGFGDTLQAVSSHGYCPPLIRAGEIDLTTHVDFAALRRKAEKLGFRSHGLLEQGAFLLKLGLETRLQSLLSQAKPDQQALIKSGAYRLIDPHQMGSLFKVTAISSPSLSSLYPFSSP